MPLNPPSAGLHRIGNHSKQPVKAQVVIAPGDALDVSDDLGALWDDLPVFQIPAGATLSAVASATNVKFSVNATL